MAEGDRGLGQPRAYSSAERSLRRASWPKAEPLVLDIGLYGIWGGVIRQWLDELLPEDAAQRCEGRVELLVTTLCPGRLAPTVELPKMRVLAVSDFADRAALIDANLASVHAHVESKLAQA